MITVLKFLFILLIPAVAIFASVRTSLCQQCKESKKVKTSSAQAKSFLFNGLTKNHRFQKLLKDLFVSDLLGKKTTHFRIISITRAFLSSNFYSFLFQENLGARAPPYK